MTTDEELPDLGLALTTDDADRARFDFGRVRVDAIDRIEGDRYVFTTTFAYEELYAASFEFTANTFEQFGALLDRQMRDEIAAAFSMDRPLPPNHDSGDVTISEQRATLTPSGSLLHDAGIEDLLEHVVHDAQLARAAALVALPCGGDVPHVLLARDSLIGQCRCEGRRGCAWARSRTSKRSRLASTLGMPRAASTWKRGGHGTLP